MSISADDFIRKWRPSQLRESQGSQEHFIDLCRLLDEPTPAEADPKGDWYCFERGATKSTGGEGWADVWKRGHFGWEYKGKHKDLNAAFVQLQRYALALENPPLLVTCDMDRIVITTNWTNAVSQTIELALDDLRDASNGDILKSVMSNPDRLRPGTTREQVTESAAGEFAQLAFKLRSKGQHDPQTVAHFINRLIFCMFAEDAQLLPDEMFTRMLRAGASTPRTDLFITFKSHGGWTKPLDLAGAISPTIHGIEARLVARQQNPLLHELGRSERTDE